MKSAQPTCSTCTLFSPVHGCWAAANFVKRPGTPQVQLRQPDPQDSCKNHQAELEDQALDAAIHAFWQPLLIKSRRTAARA